MFTYILNHIRSRFSIDKHGKILYNYGMNTQYTFENIKINSCGISDCDAAWHWDTGESGFQDFDLWFVLRGKGRIITERETAEVERGSCLLLFPETHYVGEHGSDHLLIMNVHFSFSGAERALFRGELPFLYRKIHDISYMRSTLSRVIRLYNSAKAGDAEAFFRAALAEYFLSGTEEESRELGKDKPGIVQKICDIINISPEAPHSLADLAAEYGYSADYLGRIFSRGAGIPFSEYLANARVNKAKFLLSSTSLSVEGVAEALGYYDACYFSRQFKRITGTSPGKYRKG